ncbi:MAG TPA: hypothetical protein VGP79_08985 [Bryobacteraceae bacterium]|jgi:hypothetical protein|nr:hypothetical protein [Bryobacteraceae bacterium]
MQFLRVTLAGLVGVIATLVFFVFVAVILPMGALIAIHGRQSVDDSPGGGAAILFVSVPVAGMVSIPAFLYIADKAYAWFRRRIT